LLNVLPSRIAVSRAIDVPRRQHYLDRLERKVPVGERGEEFGTVLGATYACSFDDDSYRPEVSASL
jgi:hypothetical protein